VAKQLAGGRKPSVGFCLGFLFYRMENAAENGELPPSWLSMFRTM
jgi:hypothetical protein